MEGIYPLIVVELPMKFRNITIFVEGNGPLLVERTSEYYREISLPPLPVAVKLQSVGKCTVHTTQCGSAAAAWSMMGTIMVENKFSSHSKYTLSYLNPEANLSTYKNSKM